MLVTAPMLKRMTFPTRIRRVLFGVLAVLSLGLAFVGAVLPGIPATEFVLLAVWLASRSSPALQRWIEQHPLWAESLRCWKQEGAIRRSTRVKSLLLCAVGVVLLLYWQTPLWVTVLAIGGMTTGQLFIWTRPYPAMNNL